MPIPKIPTRHLRFWGGLCCFSYTLIFAVHYLVAKEVLESIDVWTLSWIRGWVGGALLAIVFWSKFKTNFSWSLLLTMSGLAVLGFGLNQILFLEGLKHSTASQAALISNTIPIVSILLSLLFGLEPFRIQRFFGILVPFLGISGLFYYQHSLDLKAGLYGNLLMFSSVFCLSTFFVLAKKFLQDKPAEVTTPLLLLLGGTIFAFTAGFEIRPALIYVSESWTHGAMILFEVVVSTSLAYYLNFLALRLLPVSSIVIFAFLQMPLTAILGFFVFGTSPSLGDFIVLAFLFFGILLIFRDPSPDAHTDDKILAE